MGTRLLGSEISNNVVHSAYLPSEKNLIIIGCRRRYQCKNTAIKRSCVC